MSRLFGTDGIRGMANEYPMTAEMAVRIGRAIAGVLYDHPERCGKSSFAVGRRPLHAQRGSRRARVVVGKDTRLANYMIENALVAGLCSMGADVYLIGPLPTPGVAFVTQSMRADAGVMISASHNPFHDTGIKIFSADGYKLPDELEDDIERRVLSEDQAPLPTGDLVGKAFRIEDAIGRYLVFLKSAFSKDLDLQGLRLVVDSAHGAAYKVAPLVFEELGAEVIRLGVEPNGVNINAKSGALHPAVVASATLQYRADLGIALDGDGDRCIFSDETGAVVDGDQIIGLCAIEMAKAGRLLHKTVVTTPMSNFGLELALKQHSIRMVRAQVGDRYVVEMMRKEGFNLGGEQSGHIVFLDHSTTGDGILAALKVLEAVRRTGKPLSELKKGIELFPQSRVDVRVARRSPLEEIESVRESIRGAELKLAGSGRVFVRYSGTEPVARVLVEGRDRAVIDTLSREIARCIQSHLG